MLFRSYGQYDTMDTDSEVNAAFDILAEFCTQANEENGTPFQIFFKDQATQTEIKIIKKYLQQWTRMNKFNIRMFKIVRNAFKYGDSFFVRDPETQSWLYIDPAKVDKIIVNESEGKKIVRDIYLNDWGYTNWYTKKIDEGYGLFCMGAEYIDENGDNLAFDTEQEALEYLERMPA